MCQVDIVEKNKARDSVSILLFPEIRSFYDTMRKIMVESDRPKLTL